jgi:hypothetical protein
MYLKWYVYPSTGTILDENIGRLPYAPDERFGQYVSYLSPVWDVDLQQYVDEYLYKFIDWRVQFEEAFNCFCTHKLEVHCDGTPGQYNFPNKWLIQFINSNGQLSIVSP